MGNLKTKSKKSKKNSGHVLNTSPISNTNICSNPNSNTCPNPNLNSCPNPTEKKNQMKKVGGSDTSTPAAQEKCQKCGSTEFIPVCYGYPSAEGWEKYEKGELILGGCCVLGEQPNRVCKICNKDRIYNDKDEEDDWD